MTLDLTEALRPSELFALRWRSFDNEEILTITETVYGGKIRPYGKTDGSLTDVHLPPALAKELLLWRGENPKAGPDSFLSNHSRRLHGHEELPQSRPHATGRQVGSSKGEVPDPAPH
jgi:integrase